MVTQATTMKMTSTPTMMTTETMTITTTTMTIDNKYNNGDDYVDSNEDDKNDNKDDDEDDDEDEAEPDFFTPHQQKPGNIFDVLAIDEEAIKPNVSRSKSSIKRARKREKAARTPKSKRNSSPVNPNPVDEIVPVAPKTVKARKSFLQQSPAVVDIPNSVSQQANLDDDFSNLFTRIKPAKAKRARAKPVVMPSFDDSVDDVPELLPISDNEIIDGKLIPASQTMFIDVNHDGIPQRELIPRTKELFNQYYNDEDSMRSLAHRINYNPRESTKMESIRKYIIKQLYNK